MAFKLTVNDSDNGLNFNVKYENMATGRTKQPKILTLTPEGKEVKNIQMYQGQPLTAGMTQRKWIDIDGQEWGESQLTNKTEDGQAVEKISQTKVFDVIRFDDLKEYTNSFVIDKYYELFPSDNDMKKDIDRDLARQGNLFQMYRLWDYLNSEEKVAMGEFNTSSRGFITSYGYIRALEIEKKWGLEIGVFKERKTFKHLNEGIPQPISVTKQKQKTNKLSMI